MFKPVTAGLMCLGLATLGVTMLRGEVAVEQQEEKADVLFYKAELLDELGVEGELTQAITEAAVDLEQEIRVDVADIHTEIGEINFTGPEGAGVKKDVVVRFAHPAGVVDAATRETLERLVKQLREDEAKLRGAQRNEEADQKSQSAATLEAVLKGHGPLKVAGFRTGGMPHHVAVRMPPFAAHFQAEQAVLQSKIAELQAKRAKLQLEKPDSPEIAELEKAILGVKKGLDERMDHFRVVRQKLAVDPRAHPAAAYQLRQGPWQQRIVMQSGPEAESLRQKGDALLRAAEVLSSAGLDDKARELKEKADKVLTEAKQLAERRHAEVTFSHPGGPPMELHQALNELREQVQQLRKEVGELRSLLLEKKQ